MAKEPFRGYDGPERRVNTVPERYHIEEREAPQRPQVIAGTSVTAAVAGVGAVVLAILALLGLAPMALTAIGAIAIGVGFLTQGAGIGAHRATSMKNQEAPVVGGSAAQFLGGIAGVALGILALLGIASYGLLAIAAMTFGGTLILSAAAVAREGDRIARRSDLDSDTRESVHEANVATAQVQAFAGVGAIVLGILGLTDIGPETKATLIQIAPLVVGAAMLLSGGMLGALSGRRMSHQHS